MIHGKKRHVSRRRRQNSGMDHHIYTSLSIKAVVIKMHYFTHASLSDLKKFIIMIHGVLFSLIGFLGKTMMNKRM